MSLPSPHAIVVLSIAVMAFYLYSRPRMRMEMVALLMLLALALLFHFFPLEGQVNRITDADVLSGFGHPALIAILCLMILGRGLLVTGALEPLVRILTRIWRRSASLGLFVTLAFGMGASAFINDTPVLVMMLPMLLGIAERTGTSPAKSLMPVNLAILGGGMLTAFGTSTNLLVISIATDLGVMPIGLFDFTAISAAALLVAFPYLWLVAPRLLRQRVAVRRQDKRRYVAVLRVGPRHALVGRTLAQASRMLGQRLPFIQRFRMGFEVQEDESTFEAGDEIVLSATPEELREIASVFSTQLFDREGPGKFVEQGRPGDDEGVVEVVIGAKSPLCGRTLKEARFAEWFGVVVIALHRSDTDLLRAAGSIATTRLLSGDLLLVQGPESGIERLRGQWDLMVLDSKLLMPRTPLAPWALVIMVAVVATAAFKILPVHIAALAGVVAMLWKGCVKFEGVGRAMSPEVILLVASSIALGLSLVGSGAADWLASGAVRAVASYPPAVQIATIMAMSALLTNFVSNSAAAAIGTPVAVTMARQLGLPAEPFVLAILFGANLSYATPMAYQTNLLIMNAAGYSFRDFVRVGLPLVLLMLVTLSYKLVQHYGL
jgi:di/tricarboxylate transporter